MDALARPEAASLPLIAGRWRRESRALIALGLPLIMTALSQMAMSLTDAVRMGRLGAEALAAGTLAVHFVGFVFLIGFGITAAVAPMAAQAIGARRFKDVRRAVRQGLWAAVAVAAPLMLLARYSGSLLTLLGQDPAIAAESQRYLRAMVWGFLPALWYVVLSEFLAAHSRPLPALVVSLIAIPVNALGNYALMFGHFGLPKLGLIGAGVSTAIVDGFLFLGLLGFVSWDRRLRRYRILARIWRPDWQRFFELFRVGLPIAGTLMAEMGLFFAATLLIGLFGTDQLAGHGIATECVALVYMIPYGLAQAATVRVGLAHGARSPQDVRLAAWTAMTCSTTFGLLAAAAFWFLGPEIVGLFLDPARPENRAAAAFAVSFLQVAALFQFVDALQVVTMGALRGLKDTRIPMVLAIVGYWGLGFTSAMVLALEFDLEGRGAWIGFAVGLTAAAAMMQWRFRVLARRV